MSVKITECSTYRNGTVIASDNFQIVVEDEDSNKSVFNKNSLNYPGDYPVGTKGKLKRCKIGDSSFTLEFFVPQGDISVKEFLKQFRELCKVFDLAVIPTFDGKASLHDPLVVVPLSRIGDYLNHIKENE